MEIADKLAIIRMSKSSWFKIVYQRKIIHIDPGYAGFFENQQIPINELNDKADYIIVSHPHKDHLREDIIERLWKPETTIICPQACLETLSKSADTVKPKDKRLYENMTIETVDAYNTPEGHSIRKFHQKGDYVGYIITLGEVRLYFAGDTDLIPEMKSLGNVDIAFLPIGGTYVMDHEEALTAAITINPEVLVAMHHADTDMNQFKHHVESRTTIKVVCLQVGERTEF